MMAHATVEFDTMVEQAMSEWHVPGLAIAVITGEDIYTKGFGFATLPDQKVTSETLFDCASTSKSFTAAAVASLVEDNEKYPNVQWNTPVSKLLPEDFVLSDPQYTKDVTIEDVLGHRTGMLRHDDSYLGYRSPDNGDAKALTRNLRNLPLTYPLRAQYQYCNIMYTAASYLVEKLSNTPYAEYLQTRFWDPLEMKNTFHGLTGVEAGNATAKMATGYSWQKSTQEYDSINVRPEPEGQGAGCIMSGVGDFAKWVRSMIKRNGPLTQGSYDELRKPRSIMNSSEEDVKPFYSTGLYALGWSVETYRGHTVIEHDGGMPGFTSVMRYLPDKEWGIVMFTNANHGWNAAQVLCAHLVDELIKVPTPDRVDWPAFYRDMFNKDEAESESKDPFPKRPENPLPTSLPLDNYTGKYHNAGYNGIVVEVKDDKLFADCWDRAFPFNFVFEHVSREFFVAEMRSTLQGGETSKLKAEFRLDEANVVHKLGIGFEEDMKDELIWFERVH